MDNLITKSEIESVILKLPTNKSLGPDGFTDEVDQRHKEPILNLLKSFQKLKRENSQRHSRSHHHPDTNTRQREPKEKISG